MSSDSSANTSHVNSSGLGGSSFLSSITSPLLPRSLASFNPLSGYSSMTDKSQFTSRFLKKGSTDSVEQSDRYSENGNLSLRASVGSDVVVRGAGLKGVLARLDEPSINRSSSGSSHGSGEYITLYISNIPAGASLRRKSRRINL